MIFSSEFYLLQITSSKITRRTKPADVVNFAVSYLNSIRMSGITKTAYISSNPEHDATHLML